MCLFHYFSALIFLGSSGEILIWLNNFTLFGGKYCRKKGIFTDIRVNTRWKLLEIWLPQHDRDSPEIKALLQTAAENYRAQDFLPVIYESGTGDLAENTAGLLLRNSRLLNENPSLPGSQA